MKNFKACNIKNQQAKSSVFKNINKIDGVLARHIKSRENPDYQYQKFKNEKSVQIWRH